VHWHGKRSKSRDIRARTIVIRVNDILSRSSASAL
jgi:hypothetical protein